MKYVDRQQLKGSLMDDKKIKAEARRKRTLAILKLREAGLTDSEIEAELGYDPNDVLPRKFRSDRVEAERVSTFAVDDDGIIDAEIISEDEPSSDQPIRERAMHLPAIISRETDDSTSENKRDWSKSSVPERRCRAHKKNGAQCSNSAIKGATVCRYHGGASKHVKAAARARIENAQDRLAKELLGMAIDPNMTPQVKLAAIRDALDRGGLKPPTTVEVGTPGAFEEVFSDIVTGSRESYRQGLDEPESSGDNPMADLYASGEVSPGDYGGPEGVDYQHYSPTAPAADTRDSDRPRATGRREYPPRDRPQPRGYAVTGEDAIRLANRANAEHGSLRALPPGRGVIE